ncbi:MAG: hypothetical protein IKF39_12600 [Oscillospiraceae bacterium]|nr:hypothetical protein [Oscillospiraceae bacterium]
MEEKKVGLSAGQVASKILFAVVLLVLAVVLVNTVPAGEFDRMVEDGHTVIDPESFRYIEGAKIPLWYYFAAPFISVASSSSTLLVMVMLWVMGGVFALLDRSKSLTYLVTVLMVRYREKKYRLMFVMVFVLMLLGSTLSFYDQAALILPLTLGICFSAGWDSLMAMGMSVLSVGYGFACSTLNPFTVGIPQTIAGLPLYSGIVLRVIVFLVIYALLAGFLYLYGKKLDRDPSSSYSFEEDKEIRKNFNYTLDETLLTDRSVRRGALFFLGCLLFSVLFSVLALVVPALNSLSMVVILLSLLVGAFGSAFLVKYAPAKQVFKDFLKGTSTTLFGVLVIMIIMGIRQIIVAGNVMDTILHFGYVHMQGISPVIVCYLILFITMVMEFVVGSASTKAYLILPLILPLGSMVGLTSQTIVQAYMFGDSFSNMFYPTSTMILLTTGIMGLPLSKWYKWTWKLILATYAVVLVTLAVCVGIGYGPF